MFFWAMVKKKRVSFVKKGCVKKLKKTQSFSSALYFVETLLVHAAPCLALHPEETRCQVQPMVHQPRVFRRFSA